MQDRCPFAKKITYLSRAAAEAACFDGMTPYTCRHYPHLHIGHNSGPSARQLAAQKPAQKPAQHKP